MCPGPTGLETQLDPVLVVHVQILPTQTSDAIGIASPDGLVLGVSEPVRPELDAQFATGSFDCCSLADGSLPSASIHQASVPPPVLTEIPSDPECFR